MSRRKRQNIPYLTQLLSHATTPSRREHRGHRPPATLCPHQDCPRIDDTTTNINHGHAATDAVNDITQQRRIVMITLGNISMETMGIKNTGVPEPLSALQTQAL